MKLRDWRTQNNITQAQLAAQLGLHVQYVSDIERRARQPAMRTAKKIRDLTNGAVSLDDLALDNGSLAA